MKTRSPRALQIIDRRVNELGVAEPTIARYDAADQILVQLPGVDDVERAKEIMLSTAVLELTLVHQGPFASEADALVAVGNNPSSDIEIIAGGEELTADGGMPGTAYYLVQRAAAITGRDLRNARPVLDEFNRPAVSFSLNPDGARRFGIFTQQNIGRPLAVVLDNRVFSVATIESRIADEGLIRGSFTQQEAADLALVLRAGALPADLSYLE